MKVTITTNGASDSKALVDALKSPMNAYDVYQSADNAVDVVINHDHEAALELLARLVLAQPQYIAIGTESVLAEQLKQTARIFAGRSAQIDAAVDEAVNGYSRAKRWRWPRDPILLDLDGDGLETVGLVANVYFDHDGD
ncbi:hypothetical protein, partial [Pelomicrobium sp.]|uniref:hypothetical protein n=1 Tax=Pelomicrobium sp. TaxID=2815319 RepID=UPI002FDD87CF